MEEQIKGQMDIYSFLDPEEKKTQKREPVRAAIPNPEGDPDYLGLVTPDFAERIRGRQLNFSELSEMIGKKVLYRHRFLQTDGKEVNRYIVVMVLKYVEEVDPVFGDDLKVICRTDRCLVKYRHARLAPAVWLDERWIFGGTDLQGYGYNKSEWVYELNQEI